MRTRTAFASALLSLSLVAAGCGSDDASSDDEKVVTTTTKASDNDSGSSTGSSSLDGVDFDNMSLAEMAELADISEECFAVSILIGGAVATGAAGYNDDLVAEAEAAMPSEISDDAKVLAGVLEEALDADGQIDFSKMMELGSSGEAESASLAVNDWFTENCDIGGA